MSDTPDPFAARPYIPPHERDAEAEAPSEVVPEAADAPVDVPVADEPAPEPDVTHEPAAVGAPDLDEGEDESPGVEDSGVEEPAVDPAVESGAEVSGPFTHRFEEAHPLASPRAEDTTAELPLAPPPRDGWSDAHEPGHHQHVASYPEAERDGGRNGGNSRSKLASALAVVLIGGAAGMGGAAAYEEFLAPNTSIANSIDAPDNGDPVPQTAVEAVAAKVRPSVVQINFRAGDEGGSGTGIIISEDGQILTNNHVVETAAENDGSLIAVFNDGSHAEAKVLGRDPETDLAIIKAKGKSGLQPATLGSSKDLRVGQGVVVVGSPFGLESTVTSGIVSALNRPVATSRGDDQLIIPSFQSDAAINMGNSGGPVADMEGRVIGVVTAIRAGNEGGSIGLGFAIPIDLAKGVAGHLVKGERVEHAQIGVTVSPAVADDEITKIGAEIRSVLPNSAGAKAGLKKGDIVTAVENNPIASNDALVAAIRGYQPGQSVTITFRRGNATKKATVTLDSDGGKKRAPTDE
ncbi:MAG TPA: trypsin-like peptidase domain-containing protein [Aeromicrobium sp.]|nr:trypsin-like peptidase domain-containing protein [Aeromicrobium sp.]